MAYMPTADEKLVENWKKRGWRGQRWIWRRGSLLYPCKLTESPALQGLSSRTKLRSWAQDAFTCSKLSTPASNRKWEVEVGIRTTLLNFKVWLKRKTETVSDGSGSKSPLPQPWKKEWGVSGGGGREGCARKQRRLNSSVLGSLVHIVSAVIWGCFQWPLD